MAVPLELVVASKKYVVKLNCEGGDWFLEYFLKAEYVCRVLELLSDDRVCGVFPFLYVVSGALEMGFCNDGGRRRFLVVVMGMECRGG